jgi:hypothetical protein
LAIDSQWADFGAKGRMIPNMASRNQRIEPLISRILRIKKISQRKVARRQDEGGCSQPKLN